jgi:hypothetical protein
MKLLCCIRCNEIFSLSHTYKECDGKHGGGQYIDNLNAKVWGDEKQVFVLGFANSSFISALRSQLAEGDSKEMMSYAGQMTPKGRDFTAFVIPDAADSIIRVADPFVPVQVKF